MPVWGIILIILAVLFILLIVSSLTCFFIANIRLLEINFNRPIEFKLSQYRKDRNKMIRDFQWFDKQKFQTFEMMSRDKLKLVAQYLPTKKAEKIAIFFHGYRSSARNDFSCMLRFYQKLGYNILLVNQRSHGKSQGKAITFGVRERIDCRDWINFANKKFGEKETILVGMSMGSSTILMASGLKIPSNVKAIIADCGYTSPWNIMKEVIKTLKFPVYPTIYFIQFYCLIFLKVHLAKKSTINALRKSEIPTLFIHGKADKFVPFYMSEQNYNSKKDKKEILLVEGATHAGCYITETTLYEKTVEEWLKKYVKS